MPEIHVLDKNVAELIAAGEVIDRPASVIKELIENAVDAGASSITVEVMRGGISFMRITDDGCGIAPEQIRLAFLRHATSKVRSAEDLVSIGTMGFRGEALASVAAVSRVELLSKRKEDSLGSSYRIEGGVEISQSAAGCPDGTTLIIRDLFYNTPARLKFLKKDVAEANAVQAVVDKLSLIHPQISFRFIRDNKPVRLTSGDGLLYSSIYAVFGKGLAEELIPVDFSQNRIRVKGYTSSPLFGQSRRSMQYFFVNTRYIKSAVLSEVMEDAYRGSLMVGKHAACVLDITIDPAEVDVNVHPAKTEVRFAHVQSVTGCVYLAVKNAILNAENTKPVTPPRPQFTIEAPPPKAPLQETLVLSSSAARYVKDRQAPTPLVNITPRLTAFPARQEIDEVVEPEIRPAVSSGRPFTEKISAPITEKVSETFTEKASAPITEHREAAPELKMIGELWRTYILCEVGDELVIMDKHAAHERVRFEELRRELVKHSQLLAESIFVQLDMAAYDALTQNRDTLLDAGIEVLPGENGTAEVISLPSMLAFHDVEEVVSEAADILLRGGDMGVLFDEILHSIACRSAIKANDKSDFDDLEQLARLVWQDKAIRFCPHGRPIITVMKKREVEKNFGRIQ